MITTNADKVAKSLEEIQKQIKAKLEGMTKEFCYSVISKAANKTPLGNADYYEDFYHQRWLATGLWPMEGVARSGWDVAINSHISEKEGYGRNTAEEAIAEGWLELQSFELGDVVLVGNKRDYVVRYLNKGSSAQAPQGIMRPTIQDIENTYRADLQRMYEHSPVSSN